MMSMLMNRSFNCKNEELPPLCKFAAFSLNRDLADFTAYSPKFNKEYLTGFETRIATVAEVISPQSETQEQKTITLRIYATLDGLIDPINHLEGYIQLAGASVPLSAADFGLVKLRKSIRGRDVESVLPLLLTIDSYIGKYYTELTDKGLTDALKARFSEARLALVDDKNKKYALVSTRAAMVQINMGMLNELNTQLVEICDIGKILYKQTDKAKLKDYTFTHLMKQVRRVNKPEEDKSKTNEDAAATPEA